MSYHFCERCGTDFTSPEAYQKHLDKKHSLVKRFKKEIDYANRFKLGEAGF